MKRRTDISSATPPSAGRTIDLPGAELVGRRLAEELRAIFEAAGWPARSARSVARLLGVDVNLCQRATVTARCADAPIEALRRCPGVTGLNQLRAAFTRKKFDRQLIDAFSAATTQFKDLIQEAGGSLEQLRETLAEAGAAPAPPNPVDLVRERRQAYGAMAACTGNRMDTHAVAVFMRPGKNNLLEGFSINAYIGWQSSSGGMPLLLSLFGDATESTPEPERGERNALPIRSQVLESYSTQPPPVLTPHRAAGGVTMQILDPARQPDAMGTGAMRPADVCILNPLIGVSDPRSLDDRLHTNFVRCRYPTRELILDVFLAKELADSCKAAASVVWAGKWLTDGHSAPWHDRLPGHTPLSVSESIPSTNPSEHFASYATMLRDMVDQVGWRDEQLVTYRAVIRYPLWGAAHILTLDFSDRAE